MREISYSDTCAVTVILKLLGGRWKTWIIYILLGGTHRFNELKRLIPGITQRMLTNQLRELEQDQIVIRKVYAEVPPKVEYSLTEMGYALEPILKQLEDWGSCYIFKTTGVDPKLKNVSTKK